MANRADLLRRAKELGLQGADMMRVGPLAERVREAEEKAAAAQPLTEEEFVEEIVDPDMLQFAARFNSALGKMKAANEEGTNCLLQNDEVDAVLGYVQAVMAEMQQQHQARQ